MLPAAPPATGPIANLAAEQAVLGAILLRPQVLAEILPVLTPAEFYRPAHARIYQVMRDLHETGRPVDLVTVIWLLREQGQLAEIGGQQFLSLLSEQVGISANAGYYAQQVRNKYRLRRLAARAQEIHAACQDPQSNGDLADFFLHAESLMHDSIQELDWQGPALVSAKELLMKDFSNVTPVIGGGLLLFGCGLMIAGKSGWGKSMLRLEMALHLALGRDLWGLEIPRARRVLIIQFENIEEIEKVRLKRMLRGLKAECPDNLDFSSPLSRFDLREKVDRTRLITLIQKSGAEVVIYDPLSSLHQANENDNAQMRHIMDNLTEISRRTGTTAIVVHHYGKPGKDGAGGADQTRGASSIQDWADTLLGYSPKKSDELLLRNLDFFKVRCGPEVKPLILARDKETFLHHVSEGDTLCSPAKVTAIIEGFGGQMERKTLLRAIQSAVGCAERRAREFLDEAITYDYVRAEDHPTDARKKIYKNV